MLVIRFLRVGKKKQPSYKIVVTDKKNPPRAGRFVEQVGFYNPLTKEKVLKPERLKYWLSVGAKPSDTVYNLLISEKVIEGKKLPKHKKSKKQEEKRPETPKEPVSKEVTAGKGEKSAPEAVEKSAEEKPAEAPKEKKEEATPQSETPEQEARKEGE